MHSLPGRVSLSWCNNCICRDERRWVPVARKRWQAFDLLKAIESFVKHQPNMPVMLKRHMSAVEEQILESMGWQPSQVSCD